MDRRRGERSGNNPEIHHNRYSGRMGSRSYDNHHRSPNNYRGGFSGGDHHQRHHPFDSPPRNHPIGGGGFRPMGGGGIGDGGGYSMPLSGQKRGFSFSGRGGSSPDDTDGVSFAKLFVGSVPRTATEEEIRPLFEEHGDVIEVALIKDKRTGQQQGCCFIKYATSEEADRAIRALHNQYTLPGGVGPIQVRYADGERERLGNCLSAVEYKLFVGSLNRQATEKEVEEIFSPYGRVEDVYIMRDELKQSRGRGFVKFSHRDMAAAAINALNGTYVMRGCEQPLIVRFADPKRPRGGESRGPSFGGPGFGPRSQAPPGIRRTPNLGDPMGGQIPPNAWHPMSPQSVGSSSQATAHGFGSHFPDRGGVASVPSTMGGPSGVLGGPTNGSHPSLAALPSSNFQQGSNPSLSQIPSVGQQTSPLQKPLQSPQNLLPPMQLHPQQTPGSYPQVQTSQASIQQLDQQQIPSSASQSSFHQAFPSHQLYGSSGQVSISQPQVHQNVSSSASQLIPLNLQRQGVSGPASQQQMSVPSMQQQMLQPPQQSPNQLAQVLSQQTQALQASFQSSQQAFSQLQQQLHHIQQSNQNPTQQHSSQANKNQSSWTGMIPQTVASTSATAPAVVAPSATSGAPTAPVSTQVAVPVTCDWTEHTSPEGYKYYYNSVTKESRWEKPEELTLFEQQLQQKQQQQHQQQKPLVQLQPPSQTHPQVLSTPQISQTQQIQLQTQQHNQPHLQFQHPLSSSYQASGVIAHQNAPGFQAAQEWMWKSKPAGS